MARVAVAARRSTPGSSPRPWSSPRSWRCWTPRSPTSRCATSPAACRRRSIDSEWVITSYLAANATILPITGWLSAHLGRRNYFLLSIAVFTLASGLCGMATSLEQLILFRVIQGLAGGGLQPSQPGRPARRLPAREAGHGHDAVRRRGPARAGRRPDAGRLASPSTTTGAGSSTSTSRSASSRCLRVLLRGRRPGLPQAGAGGAAKPAAQLRLHRPGPARPGHGLLGSPAQQGAGVGLATATRSGGCRRWSSCSSWAWSRWSVREMRIANPVVNFRPLGERNFAACCIIIFCAYGVLYGASTSLPGLLQSLFGYDAYAPGWCCRPPASSRILMMLVRRRPARPGRRRPLADRRGPAVMAAGNYWMAQMNLDISPGQVVWPRVVLIVGLSMIFAPINVAAFRIHRPHLRGAAVGLLALLRNEGGSVGTSLAQTIQERREQFHSLRLGESLDPLNPAVHSFLGRATAPFLQQTGDPAAAQQLALQTLANLRGQQASALAYFDVFWVLALSWSHWCWSCC